ncbi:MAG: uridine kinase [Clostridia bacterium]|nr:uridine kinase [Clostridia bacterium]
MLIGIDDGGGAGKSTFAEILRKIDPDNITVIHMDDFYKTSKQRAASFNEIGWLCDCNRIKTQVLTPLCNEQSAIYQIYDWDLDKLNEWHYISAGGVVIVEGCYSLIDDLFSYYDFKIWIDIPPALRLLRGIERDGEVKRHLWENLWIPAEEYYFKVQQPIKSVDLVVDGSVDIDNFMVNILRMEIKKEDE